MKTQIIFLTLFLGWESLPAQTVSASAKTKSDTSLFKIGKMNFLMWEDNAEPDSLKKKKKEKEFSHLRQLGLGINGYLDRNNKIALPANYQFLDLKLEKSIAVSLNIAELNAYIIKEYLQFVTGLDFEFNNYRLSGKYRLIGNLDSLSAFDESSSTTFKKAKLTATYLTAPVLLELNTKKNLKKAFHLQVGGVAGLKIGSHSKVVYEDSKTTYKPKEFSDFFLPSTRMGLTVRVGYGNMFVFMNYMLTDMFDDKKAPELHAFSVGLLLF